MSLQHLQTGAGDALGPLMRRLHAHAGIRIDSPAQVIRGHIRERMSLLGMRYMQEYITVLDNSIDARAEWLALVDLLTVKCTRFFRQRAAFDCVADYIGNLLLRGLAGNAISFWSAGCATGQELYSIAMVVDRIVRAYQPGVDWQGIGTDISFRAIQQAQDGCFSEAAGNSIPEHYLNDYLVPIGDDRCQVSDDIRSRTHFFHSNLLHVNSAPYTDFDVIFCQNVLIYFERDRQGWIIDQLAGRLKPGGLLVLGAGEDVQWENSRMRRVSWPGVSAYRKLGG